MKNNEIQERLVKFPFYYILVYLTLVQGIWTLVQQESDMICEIYNNTFIQNSSDIFIFHITEHINQKLNQVHALRFRKLYR